MKEKISALMDGELESHEIAETFKALRGEGEAREAWRTYHLISDAMRGKEFVSSGFAARVNARLAAEPAILAPAAWTASGARWQWLPMAASFAAVAMVSAIWVAQYRGSATVSEPVAAQQGAEPAPTETARVAPPEAANDYLLAHQGYSPRNSLQGVAPYVRMVSAQAPGVGDGARGAPGR